MVQPQPSPASAPWHGEDRGGDINRGISTSSSIARLPDEVLLLVFADIQADAFRWHRGSSSLSPYKDLLACSAVCRYWGRLVPKILYRDVRLSNHNSVSSTGWGGLSVLELFHAPLLSDALGRDLRNFVTVLTLDVFYNAHPSLEHAFRVFCLCRHLRAIALHVHGGGGPNDALNYGGIARLSDLKHLTHLRLSAAACDVGQLLVDLLGVWPRLTHLDVMDCDNLVIADDAHLARPPRLQHLRARSPHIGLARLLEGQPGLREAAWKVSSEVNFRAATRGMEVLFARVRVMHLAFGSGESIASGDVAAVLCQLSSLRTIVLWSAVRWDADDLIHAIPEWVEEIGILFTAALCVPPDVLACALRRSLVNVRSITVFVPLAAEQKTWWSAQTAYCDMLTQLCGLPVEERPQSELDFLDLTL